MINKTYGLFLDPRTWKIDYLSSKNWRPDKHNLQIDLHSDAFNIPKLGINSKYSFVVATEIWEIKMRKALEYLRKKGLKIFFIPREPFKTEILEHVMFSYSKFFYNGEYYFTPDVLLAPNKIYADFWRNKIKHIFLTGYPRFDYLNNFFSIDKNVILKEYGMDERKTTIFFPSYPPYYYKRDNNQDVMFDLFDAHEQTMVALENFSKKNKNKFQTLVKIHPMSFKCYTKKIGNGKEVSGTLLKYYKFPTDHLKVIGDIRMSGEIAKKMLYITDIMVGFSSTMLLEASVVKKPVAHLLFGNSLESGFGAYKDIFPTFYDEDSLYAFLMNPIVVNSDKILSEYMFGIDGKSGDRICESIANIMSKGV